MAQLVYSQSVAIRNSRGSGGATPRSCRIFTIYRLENALKLILNFKVKLASNLQLSAKFHREPMQHGHLIEQPMINLFIFVVFTTRQLTVYSEFTQLHSIKRTATNMQYARPSTILVCVQ